MNKMYCVISHTHWDREWYKPFEQFRMQLADLINNLLDTMKEYPEYIFHLDAQTVVLEDYLEIYPEKRAELQERIANGNIIVGPWYLQNDFYLTSGEATIRNLIEGRRIAESFGACANTGYAPDQFGNISQLPQILSNFGIDNFIFGRGYAPYRKDADGNIIPEDVPAEFLWEGPDKTQILAIHLKRWYNNAQRFCPETDRAKNLVNAIESWFEGVTVTPYLLLMNGVDHLEAQEDLLPILERLNHEEINGSIRQMKMDDYVDCLKRYIEDNQVPLRIHTGELRMGDDGQILQGTLSSRSYLKRMNVLAQNELENRVEPLYAMLEKAGFKGLYPQNYIRYLWKKLMQNHPHDSICGCSRDEIHYHMEERYRSIFEVSSELMRRGLLQMAEHNEAAKPYPDEYSLIAVNTVGVPQSGVIEAELIFPETERVEGFIIYDSEGKEVEYALISKTRKYHDLFSPTNLPGCIEVDCYRIYLSLPETQGHSVQGYSVRKSNQKPTEIPFIQDDVTILENSLLRVEIGTDGSVTMTDKKSGRTLKDCIYLEECCDRGQAYLFRTLDEPPLETRGLVPTVTFLEKNPYQQKCRLSWDWAVPACYDFEHHCRVDETVEMKTELTLTLKKDEPVLEVAYVVDNSAMDHRVRLVVATDQKSDCYHADIPFDIITHKDGEHSPGLTSLVHPNTSFAVLEDRGKGVAVFTEGSHESEKLDESRLAFTLFRSNGTINRNPDDTMTCGDQWYCPENQCLRRIEGRIGLCLCDGDTDLPNTATRFRNPMLIGFTSCDPKKLTGGRPAVQDTSLSEVFFRPDPYADVVLKSNYPTVRVEGKSVQISALKQSEDGTDLVLRFYNYGSQEETVKVRAKGGIYQSNMAEDKKEFIGTDHVKLSVNPKQIITLRIEK